MKFREGDKIKFKIDSSKTENSVPRYFTEGSVDSKYIKHGRPVYKKNEGEVIAYSNGFVVVAFTDTENKIVQLGFNENDLELVQGSKRKFRISFVNSKGVTENVEIEDDNKAKAVSSLNAKRINYVIEE